MNHKLRSTTAGFAAAAAFAVFALVASSPVPAEASIAGATASTKATQTRKASVFIRTRYTMPYFSFARLLPRRES